MEVGFCKQGYKSYLGKIKVMVGGGIKKDKLYISKVFPCMISGLMANTNSGQIVVHNEIS